jgi:hypothetical protein
LHGRKLFPLNIVAAAVLADIAPAEILAAAFAVWQNKFLFIMSSFKNSHYHNGSEVKRQIYFNT